MASLQERLQMNRALLDNWSTREQLCLASAVSCSGDQNWMSVSRNLKLVCGTNNNEASNRPADWFSQKSCALQYAHLLENVETPKRKKRSSESNSRVSSPATIETPTESVLRRLTEERIQELKAEIRKGQEEYAKIHAELQQIQSPQLSEEALREMWHEVELEQDAQRIAEMKLENQLREREQRRQELQRSWRLGGAGSAVNTELLKQQENTTVVDMDVEEIIGVTKPIIPAQQQQTATSPLLSSLLKSPTATAPPVSPNLTSSARTTAPTITTLLTSGSIPNSNQPAITLNTDFIPPEKAVQLLTRPISGPPVGDSSNLSNASAHTLLSPSQSAPTLSMLLEKNKSAFPSSNTHNTATEVNSELNNSSSKSKTVECNKTDESMEIDEDVTPQRNQAKNEENVDSDEPDPNEEQQLLEVFKNIGNIELDIDVSAVIDEEVDFLKGVDEDSPRGAVESMDFESKLERNGEPATPQTQSETADDKKTEEASSIKSKSDTKAVKTEIESPAKQKEIKVETSSDDSNDNIPLAAVVTLENKERSLATPTAELEEKSNEKNFLKVKVESAITNTEGVQLDKSPTSRTISPVKVEVNDSIKVEPIDEEEQKLSEIIEKSETKGDDAEEIFEETTDEIEEEVTKEKTSEEEETAEIEPEEFATPTGDEKIHENDIDSSEYLLDKDQRQVVISHTENDNETDNATLHKPLPPDEEANSMIMQNQENTKMMVTSVAPPPPSSHNTVADTDEDSTDVSVITIATKHEDKPGTSTSSGSKQSSERSASHSRKAGSHETSSKSTEDSDSSSGNRSSKRSLLSILGSLSATKSAQAIQRALCDEQFKHKYYNTCNRRVDFEIMKKNIENGSIRSIIELQRSLLQVTTNVNLLFQPSSPVYKAAQTFKNEMQNVREFVFNVPDVETKIEKEVKEVKEVKQTTGKQGRTGSRKSLRIS